MSALLVALAAQIGLGAQAIPTLNYADPVPRTDAGQPVRGLAEVRVSQPVVFAAADALGGRLMVHAMLNLEGATMPDGQLAPGVFGEGFNDRRHPHTYAHELMASLADPVPVPLVHWSLSAGRGFAPFGTDDPMNRPALLYPVNHHWSQILERAVVVVGVRRGPVMVEAGLFNGDEPEHPRQWPSWRRFGDSWSARALVHPRPWLELQGSVARVKSPEHRPGAGYVHDKYSASLRLERPVSVGEGYLLAEWSRNVEGGFFRYSSALLELQVRRGVRRGYLRFERTDRPEETRLTVDPFRSVRPHFENSNLGTSLWTTATGGFGQTLGRSLPVRFETVVEGSYFHVARRGAGAFDPVVIWGRNDLWMASVAVRIRAGAAMHRMGRYGVAAADAAPTSHARHVH